MKYLQNTNSKTIKLRAKKKRPDLATLRIWVNPKDRQNHNQLNSFCLKSRWVNQLLQTWENQQTWVKQEDLPNHSQLKAINFKSLFLAFLNKL